MSITGARAVVRALEDEGIPFTFGIPGTHNIELYDELAQSRVRPVLVTDEQGASFMADAVWRASGNLGCVNLVPGAGLTHALSGIAEAYLDTVPLLVLSVGIRRDTGRAYQLHDVDQLAIAAPVTKAQLRAERGEDIYPTLRRACRIARQDAPGPVIVEIPAEHYLFTHEIDLDRQAEVYEAGPRDVAPAPDEATLERVLAVLRPAKRPLLYVGLGAAGAGASLVDLAERLDAPVATTLQGKGVFPEKHPLWLWPGFGDAAPPFVRAIARDCDAMLAIGCRFGEVGTGSYGFEPPGPLIHVDVDPTTLGRNYAAAVTVHSDAAAFVERLLERLPRREGEPSVRRRILDGHRALEAQMHETPSEERVTPGILLQALQRRFGPDTIFTADSGNGTFLAAELLRLEAPGRFLAPIDYSCMGYSIPAAIGAKLARPDRHVVALAGDGAFLMTGLELITAATQGIALAAFVLRDRELAQIAQFQDTALSRRSSSEVGDYDLATLCAGMGVECLGLESDGGIDDVLGRVAELTAQGRPVAVDVAIDYSRQTHFTRGVVRTNLRRLPWRDRLRFIGRALARRVLT